MRVRFVCCCSLLAGTIYGAPEEPPPNAVRIFSGQILDAQTGRGIAGLSLPSFVEQTDRAGEPPDESAVTDDQGRFEARAKPGWSYYSRYRVFLQGYAVEWVQPGSWTKTGDVWRLSGLRIAVRDFRNVRVVAGRLIDRRDGQGIANAAIRTQCPSGEQIHRTSADGSFHVELTEGECNLGEIDGYAWEWPSPDGAQRDVPPGEGPRVGFPALTWQAEGSETHRYRIAGNLVVDRLVAIRVHVVDEQGQNVENAAVSWGYSTEKTFPEGRQEFSSSGTVGFTKDGWCVFRGPQGKHRVQAGGYQPEGQLEEKHWRYREAKYPENRDAEFLPWGAEREVTLVLKKAAGVSLSGRIRLPAGARLDGVDLSAPEGSEWGSASFQLEQGRVEQGDYGVFAFDAVPPGKFRVQANFYYPDELTLGTGPFSTTVANPHSIVRSVEVGDRDVFGIELQVPSSVRVQARLVVKGEQPSPGANLQFEGREESFPCVAERGGQCGSRRAFRGWYLPVLSMQTPDAGLQRLVARRVLLNGAPVTGPLLDLREGKAEIVVEARLSKKPSLRWRTDASVNGDLACTFAAPVPDGGTKSAGTLRLRAAKGVLTQRQPSRFPSVPGEYDLYCIQWPEVKTRNAAEAADVATVKLFLPLGMSKALDSDQPLLGMKPTRVRVPEDFHRVVRITSNRF